MDATYLHYLIGLLREGDLLTVEEQAWLHGTGCFTPVKPFDVPSPWKKLRQMQQQDRILAAEHALESRHPAAFWARVILRTAAEKEKPVKRCWYPLNLTTVSLLELLGLRCIESPMGGRHNAVMYGYSDHSTAYFLRSPEGICAIDPASNELLSCLAVPFASGSGPSREYSAAPTYRGEELITITDTGSFILHNPATHTLTLRKVNDFPGLMHHPKFFRSSSVSPDGRTIVTGHSVFGPSSGTSGGWDYILVWRDNEKTNAPAWCFDAPRCIQTWMVDPEGKYFVVAYTLRCDNLPETTVFDGIRFDTLEHVWRRVWNNGVCRQFSTVYRPDDILGGTIDGVFFRKGGDAQHSFSEQLLEADESFSVIEHAHGTDHAFVIVQKHTTDGTPYEVLRIFDLCSDSWVAINDGRMRFEDDDRRAEVICTPFEYPLPFASLSYSLFRNPHTGGFVLDSNAVTMPGCGTSLHFDFPIEYFSVSKRSKFKLPVDPGIWKAAWELALAAGRRDAAQFFVDLLRKHPSFKASVS